VSARLSLIAVLLVGCRGDEATPKPVVDSPRTSSGTAAPRPTLPEHTARTAEERAALEHSLTGPEQTFLAEPIDEAWANRARDAIKNGAPWAGVECRTRQCRISFIALSSDDAMSKTDVLRALKNTETDSDLAQWMPVPPVPRPDGTLEVRLYAFFTRAEKKSSDDSSKSSL